MKRIIAMLMALFYALTNNTDYIDSGDIHFQEGYYYTLDSSIVEPDYREVNKIKDGRLKNLNECSPSIVMATPRNKVVIDEGVFSTGFYVVAGDDGKDKKLSELSNATIADDIKAGNQIVMPFTGQLLSLPQDTDASRMVVAFERGGQRYVMVIRNLSYWWCDLSRENGVHEHTWSTNSQRLPAGCLLGVATSDTTVALHKDSVDGDTVLFKEIYKD